MLRQYADANSRKSVATIATTILFLILLDSCAPYPALQVTNTVEQITAEPISTVNPYPGPSEIASTPNPMETEPPIPLETLIARATTAIFEFTSSPYPTSLPGDAGIHEGDEYTRIEMLKIGLQVENSWGGVVEGDKVSIWAGALVSDSAQGVVYVIYIYPYRTWKMQFPTSEKHGSLRVTAEQNNRLELLAADGSIFYFDVPGLTFVSSPTDAVPTATPPPTYTPLVLLTQIPTISGYPQPSTPIPTSDSP